MRFQPADSHPTLIAGPRHEGEASLLPYRRHRHPALEKNMNPDIRFPHADGTPLESRMNGRCALTPMPASRPLTDLLRLMGGEPDGSEREAEPARRHRYGVPAAARRALLASRR